MKHLKLTKIDWGKLAFAMMVLICLAALLSFMLPYESKGRALRENIELKDDSISPEAIARIKAALPIQLRVKVVSLAVKVDKDHYVGEAMLVIQSEGDLINDKCVGIIPAPRVQRMFELAIIEGFPLEVTCIKATAPAGHPYEDYPFYTIVQASTWNPEEINLVPGLSQIISNSRMSLL